MIFFLRLSSVCCPLQFKLEWHHVVAWNGFGEYAATKLRKGDDIYVKGTLVSSTYGKGFGKPLL